MADSSRAGSATPTHAPFVFLFTADTGEQYGYRDGWSSDNVFLYTGEGQVGDMAFIRGNRAIRDHVADGKDLLLFEALGKGKGYRYLGLFSCASWDTLRGPDKNGTERQVIRFHLLQAQEQDFDSGTPAATPPLSLEQLRNQALAASQPTPKLSTSQSRANFYARSKAVRIYVLARAAGVCECCCKPAPFDRKDGSPYLEPHHTKRLSDGGPDDPRWVAGVCPTCHRRIHHGQDGDQVNVELQERLQKIETVDPKHTSAGAGQGF